MGLPFYSVGHSNRSIDAFIALLRAAGVTYLADIRTLPGSRANPQFDGEALARSLGTADIGYEYIRALGGLRGRSRDVSPDVNGWWSNASFHNYADYALSAPFRAGLARLVEIGHAQRTAFMCSEAVWWRCHRRIVTDHLLARGETVLHIMGEGRLEEARLTPGAVIGPDGAVIYPAAAG